MARDEETLRQLEELREEIASQRARRGATRRRLNTLEESAAEMGRDAPPHITNEIDDLRAKRRKLDASIAELGKRVARLELAPTPAIEVLPRGDATYDIQLAPAIVDSRLQAVERRLDMQDEQLDRLVRRQEEAADWRERETMQRHGGQSYHRQRDRMLLAVLVVIALGVIFIAVRVY